MAKKDTPTFIKIISVNVGCMIRLARLKNKISQHELGIKSGTDNTSIGRIERGEVSTAWYKIVLICQYLGLDYDSLFTIRTKAELLELVNECYILETKLTEEKRQYYVKLKNHIESLF